MPRPKGVPQTPEQRAKISAAQKGRVLSAEQRAKISAALKGRVFSEEHRAKISAAQKGRPLSAEHRASISVSHKGQVLSAEHRAKISAAVKAGYHRRLTDPTHPAWDNCQICGEFRPLERDHDHSCCASRRGRCGRCERGRICSSCNSLIRSNDDNPHRLRVKGHEAAAEYLERYLERLSA